MRGSCTGALVVAVGGVLSACGAGNAGLKPAAPPIDVASFDGTPHPTATPSGRPRVSLPDEMRAAVAKFDAAITRRPETPSRAIAPALATLYASNASLRIPGPIEAQGRDAIAAAWEEMLGPIQPRDFAASRIVMKGNVLVVQWDFRGGLNKEDGATAWYGIGPKTEPTPIGFSGLSIWTFDGDGLIVQDHTYFDVVNVYAQLDAGPPGVEPLDLTTVNTDDPATVEAKSTPEEQRNAQVPAKLAAAVASKSVSDFVSFFGEKIVREGPHGLVIGVDGQKQAFEDLTKTFPDLKETADNVVAAGDYVVCEVTATGTQLGPMGRWPATKKQATWHGGEIYLLGKDGKIIHDWIYINRLELLSQLGLWKRP